MLSPNAKLGPYEIVVQIGAGGMGEVYKARDTRLERIVAIKVLPAHLADNPELRERFEREAKTIAGLNHPNICVLHDIGRQDGIDFLVMEYLEGETLAMRLLKGPLPLDQVLRYAIEISDALDKAHRKGVTHRDIKPGNIMLTKTGSKLLDFGLAKLKPEAAPAHLSVSQLPTLSQNPTVQGTILGTLQYMAPEQVEGRTDEIDGRADIFSFGAVVHEMATGRKAFTGRSAASLIGAILKDEPPPISSLQAMTPPQLDRVVKKCLAKEPEARFQAASDLTDALKWIAEGGSQAGIPAPVVARRKSRERLAWAVAATAIVIAAVALGAVAYFRRAPAPSELIQLSLLPPEGEHLDPHPASAAISPDGKFVAFLTGSSITFRSRLWIRSLGSPNASPIENSEGAFAPFWSPDSQWVAFFSGSDRKLKKASVVARSARVIADATGAGGGRQSGTWNSDNVILLGMDTGKPLYTVSADGGPLTPQTNLDTARGDRSHFRPRFLPDGRHFLFQVDTVDAGDAAKNDGIYVGSLDSQEIKPVMTGFLTTAQYVPGTKQILYVRQEALWAQPFDTTTLGISGKPIHIVDSVAFTSGNASASGFSVANSGVLIYRPSAVADTDQPKQLAWFDRTGKQIQTIGKPDPYLNPRLSPDGLQVAAEKSAQGRWNIWVLDAATGSANRLTFENAGYGRKFALWAPGGKSLIFRNSEGLSRMPSSGQGQEELLLNMTKLFNLQAGGLLETDDLSPDGKMVVGFLINPSTNRDVMALSLQGEPKYLPVAATTANEVQPQLSPDGRWVAFASDETGRHEIYVQTFPEAGSRRLVSTDGGVQPKWRPDGKELFYVAPDATLMAAPVLSANPITLGSPVTLFKSPATRATGAGLGTRAQYDISPDGRRILINVSLVEPESPPIHVLLNWTAGLQK